MYNIPRMRSIMQLADEYRKADPQTKINQHYLRQLIAKHSIPYLRAGKKYLINADILEGYLTRGDNNETDTDPLPPYPTTMVNKGRI